MRPIPKRLLIHSAAAIKKSKSDTWGNSSDAERTAIENIRLEPSSSLRISKDNRQIQLDMLLFFDCVNSRPRGFDFSGSDRIEADGKQYNIVSVKKFYDERRLHHLEVGLCL